MQTNRKSDLVIHFNFDISIQNEILIDNPFDLIRLNKTAFDAGVKYTRNVS